MNKNIIDDSTLPSSYSSAFLLHDQTQVFYLNAVIIKTAPINSRFYDWFCLADDIDIAPSNGSQFNCFGTCLFYLFHFYPLVNQKKKRQKSCCDIFIINNVNTKRGIRDHFGERPMHNISQRLSHY